MTSTPHPHGHTGRNRRFLIFFVGGLAVIGVAIGVGIMTRVIANPFDSHSRKAAAAQNGDEVLPTVKVIRPKRESSVPIVVNQIAMVEPYFRADLRARASGIVRRVHFEIGEKVKKGQVLVEIDVPESEQEVAKAEAIILQREQERKVSDAKYKDAVAAKDVSAATIKQREADVQAAIATRDLKKRRLERFKELAAKGSVVGSLVEEEERDYLASEATVNAAKANVDKARADYSESESKIEAAAADIELKKAFIVVGRKDLERAKAIADYGKVVAPFDGVVIRRAVDPGSFVQNATSGTSEVLISVVRVDMVTVVAKFPDSAAPSINDTTPAEIQIDDLPGVTIAAEVTRYSPTVDTVDRTMRVEVDLFNGSEEEYRRIEEGIQRGGPDRPTKGASDTIPVRAFPIDAPKSRRLLAGMTGTMKLSVGGFGESYIVPSSAVYSRSGTSYLLLVQSGKTKQVPIHVQLNDGKTARVTILDKRRDSDGKTRDVFAELTGNEEVVIARQLETGDGANVKVARTEW